MSRGRERESEWNVASKAGGRKKGTIFTHMEDWRNNFKLLLLIILPAIHFQCQDLSMLLFIHG